MQKISLGNREYVKASEVAKRFKYTQDYVGQLCRGDKVDARLVGRVWYVNLDSVKEYRKTKHSSQKKSAKISKQSHVSINKKKSAVRPVIRAKTARKLQEVFPKEAHAATKYISTKYAHDDVSVIPVVNSSAKNTKAQNKAVSSKKNSVTIKVRPDSRKSTKYTAEKMPEITLQAKLKVTDSVQNANPEKVETSAVSDVISAEIFDQKTPVKPHKTRKVAVSQKISVDSGRYEPGTQEIEIAPHTNKRRVSNVVLATVSFALVGFSLLSLGAGRYIETAGSDANSGWVFDYASVIQKVTSVLQ